ncbi:hypothetical protein BRARA_B01663 [Brassica rapa]|uniref:Uncharacterized protein n=1 Tax=Brassica campestris TaxID=3711 RepID=A0A398A9R1_BRACM|nr:hypothetical protein BRARA_B01663 [Brassica rapa]
MHLERRNHIAAQYASINSGFKKSPQQLINDSLGESCDLVPNQVRKPSSRCFIPLPLD